MIKKRILSILLILCIMLATRSVPVMAVTLTGNFIVVGGAYGADYTYANNVLTISTNTPLTISGTTTTDKIVVNATSAQVTLSGVDIQLSSQSACAFDIQGNSVVNLTLTGTNTLKSGNGVAGLQVQTKGGMTASVTIGGDGSLNVTGGDYSAGIGGGDGGAGGEITIGGGTINATGNGSGSGHSGAGIGGGQDGGGGLITITGGVITATGAENSAGIGGGASPTGMNNGIGTIEISGGTVIATGGSWSGAGIGSGYQGTGGTITISGTSNVTAIGGGDGAGIGGGASGAAGTIKISNTAKVTAVSIGTKSAIDDDDGNITPSSDTVANILMGNFKSSVTSGVKTEVKDASGNALSSEISYTPSIAYQSIAFTVPIDSYTLYTNGVKQDGTKASTTSNVFAVTAGLNTFTNVEGSKVPTILNVSTPGILPTGVTHASNVFTIGTGANNTTINVTGTTLNTHTIVVATGVTNLTLILNNVSITSYTKSPIDLQGTANVTIQLADGTTNLLDASNAGDKVGTAGICTNGTATITISGNTGSLIAKGGHSGAGIGGGKYSTGGNITISGGTVTATGGHSGAGIGGTNGTFPGGTNGTGGNITISGGTVTATGGTGGAGIGGGNYGAGGTITISGGTATATGGTDGAGIGGGINGAGGNITISGGTVTATGGQFGAGIGGGTFGAGGTIAISGGTVTATDGGSSTGIGGGYNGAGGNITIGVNAVVMAVSSFKRAIDAVSGSGNVINAKFVSTISSTDDTYLKCNSNVLRLPATYQTFAFSATAHSSVVLYSDQSCTTKLYDIVTNSGDETAIPVSTHIYDTPTPVKTAVAPTYTMTASALTAYSSQTAGYASAPASQTVTINNTGNQTITLTQPTSTNYNIGELSTTSIGVSQTATFTVQPKTGLGVGAYNETISISGTNGATASVTAEFSVTAPTYTVTFDSKGGSEVASLINVAAGATIALPTAPSKPNYIFGSWYSDQECIVAWNFDLDSVLGNMTLYAKWTPNSTPTPDSTPPTTPSTPSSNTSNVDKNIGQITKDQQLDKSVPNTNLNNNTENLKSSVFTTEELDKIEAGEDAKVILKVTDINNSVSEDDKKLIAKNLDEGDSVMYIDLSLYKKVGNGAETKITETKNKISISIEVPAELRSTDMAKNRTYKIVRIHEGVVTIIEGTYDPVTNMFTFETDRFSTYALAYEDTSVTTGADENDNIVTVTNDFSHLRLTAIAAETSQKLTYTKISGADGYLIYGSLCGTNNKMVKLADVSGTIASYNHKGLKKAKYYKYYVQAYKIIDGKKVVIATSRVIHSITTNKTYANPTKVVSDTSTVILAVGTSRKVTCKDVVTDSKKVDYHTSVIRYETTNKAIATVTKSGNVKAISEGTCYIYGYAQNGVYKKIKVTVK